MKGVSEMENKAGTYKQGYLDALDDVVKILSDAEKNPDDITRLSRGVEVKLLELKGINHGCN